MSRAQIKIIFFYRIELFLGRIKNDLISDVLSLFKRRLTNIIKLQYKPSSGVSICNKNHLLSKRKEVDNDCICPTLPFIIQLLGVIVSYPLQNPIKNIICYPE